MLDGCTGMIVFLLEVVDFLVLEVVVAAAGEVAAVPVPVPMQVPVVVEGKREGVVIWEMNLWRSWVHCLEVRVEVLKETATKGRGRRRRRS